MDPPRSIRRVQFVTGFHEEVQPTLGGIPAALSTSRETQSATVQPVSAKYEFSPPKFLQLDLAAAACLIT